MKNLFLGAAIVALSVAPAAAGPIGVTVGGYQNTVFYMADVDEGAGGNYANGAVDHHILEDGELIVRGKGKTKGGLTVGFEMQFETSSDQDHSDEHYAYVKGGFGKVEIGGENSVAAKMAVKTPKFVGWKTYDNNFKTWAGIDGDDSYRKPIAGFDEGSKDAAKINYYSPKVNGVQLGVSYTPHTNETDGPSMTVHDVDNSVYEGIISYALKYSGKVRGTKLKLSYTSETAEDGGTGTTENAESAFGLSLARGPVTAGAMSYIREVDENGTTNREEVVVHYGLAYKLSKSTSVGIAMHSQTTGDGTNDEYESDIMVIGGATKLAGGVKLTYSHETVEYTDIATTANSGDGTYTGIGLLLKF